MTVGTCQRCRHEHPLDDGRHVSQHLRYPGTRALEHTCAGSGKLCTEAQATAAAKSRQRALARIDRLRADAAVAHDALSVTTVEPTEVR